MCCKLTSILCAVVQVSGVLVNVNAAHLVRRFWDDLGITWEEFNGELIQASDDFIGA
jgi:hypothetical protein